LKKFANKAIKAKCNYELWDTAGGVRVHELGAPSDVFVDDAEVLEQEKKYAATAELEDASWGDDLSDMRIGCALRIDFLIALTFELNLWEWPTSDVVLYFVKPFTEEFRCRFADHPFVRKYKGKADALMSHSWGNLWGELVAAAAQGAPMGRYVWICALANRQWSGNKADIDFEPMVKRTNAIVVANPVPESYMSEPLSAWDLNYHRENLKSDIKQFTVSRIWCIGEDFLTKIKH